MSDLYTQAIKTPIVKSAKQKFVSIVRDYTSPLEQAIPDMILNFDQSLDRIDPFCSIMSCADDLMSDELINTVANPAQCVKTVSTELAGKVFNDLYEWITSIGGELALTLSNGLIVRIKAASASIQYFMDETWNHLMVKVGNTVVAHQFIGSIQGKYICLWDLVKDQVQNSELISLLKYCLQLCSRGFQATVDFTGLLQSYVLTRSQAIRSIAADICTAFSHGGLYGVARYVFSYFEVQQGLTYDDEGLLTFTNNSSLVPQIYIAGVLLTAVTTVAEVVAAVVAFAAPIVGLVIGAVAGVIQSVFSIAQYDYSTQTLAAIDVESNSILAPMALGQNTYSFDHTHDSDYDQSILDLIAYEMPFQVQVVGGTVLVSIANDKIRTEFHPDMIDRREAWKQFLLAAATYHASSQAMQPWSLTFNLSDVATFSNIVETYYAKDSLLVNEPNGILSAANDQALREIIVCNILLYICFTSIGMNHGQWSDLNVEVSTAALPTVNKLGGVVVTNWSNSSAATTLGAWIGWTYEHYVAGSPYTIGNQDWLSWSYITNLCSAIASSVLSGGAYGPYIDAIPRNFMKSYLQRKVFYGNVEFLDGSVNYAVRLPQYDRTSFWFSTIATIAAVAAITAAAVTITIAAKGAIRRSRAQRAARLESAWQAYTQNPTSENYNAYRRSVFSNNWFASVFGGTKYSKEGMWAQTYSDDSGHSTIAGDYVKGLLSEDADRASDISSAIYLKLTGSSYSPQ